MNHFNKKKKKYQFNINVAFLLQLPYRHIESTYSIPKVFLPFDV